MKLWIPDSADFENLAQRLEKAFPNVSIARGDSAGSEDIAILELPASGGERMVQVVGGEVKMEYRLERDMDLLLENLRERLFVSPLRETPGIPDAAPDVPDLDEDVFTLGGRPSVSSGKLPKDALLASKVQDDLPEVRPVLSDSRNASDEVPKESGGSSAVAFSQEAENIPEQTTAPGILRRNTIVANVDEIEKIFRGEDVSHGFTLPQWDGNTASFLLELHCQRFSGQVEVALPHFRLSFSWVDGRIAGVDGIAPILARLLQLGSDGIGLDLTRTLSDPIEWAQRRHLIASDEAPKWQERCRREAVRLAVSSRRIPSVLAGSGEAAASSFAPIDPRGPLFGGILEHIGADEACALCDGEEPKTLLHPWDDLFADPDFDPLWIRALHLFSGGFSWEEACIRAGMGIPESWKLAYASRLFGLTTPALLENPAAEIRRRRFRRFEESLQSQNPAHIFGDDPVAARRLQQDILLLFTQLPAPLRLLLSGDFEKLKKSMDKALSVLSF